MYVKLQFSFQNKIHPLFSFLDYFCWKHWFRFLKIRSWQRFSSQVNVDTCEVKVTQETRCLDVKMSESNHPTANELVWIYTRITWRLPGFCVPILSRGHKVTKSHLTSTFQMKWQMYRFFWLGKWLCISSPAWTHPLSSKHASWVSGEMYLV